MTIKTALSPNFSLKTRKKGDIKFVILHYTGMQSTIESLIRLLDPGSNVSCHYLIDRKGKIIQMVKEDQIAWHAGKSRWKNLSGMNKKSIGIEIVNKGHLFGYQKFTKIQIIPGATSLHFPLPPSPSKSSFEHVFCGADSAAELSPIESSPSSITFTFRAISIF